MTNPENLPVDAIRGLIEERERYEGWIATLDARREATAAHVFDRVRVDYDGRLRSVRERLVTHVAPLRDEESTLARRQDELERGLTDRQDELAELELRALVGEFSPEDGERRVQEQGAAVRQLDGERRAAAEQLQELRTLLARAGAGTPEREPAPPAVAPEPTAAAPRDDAAQAAPADPPAAPPARPAWQSATGRDDEAFVGTGERLDSLAASLGGSVPQPAAPTAASAGQEKTLRCSDCGEMNFPTEWYCERCGGELAAM